ncbi:hypothetical protein WICPIJ_005918 [Wickerhamomyces pijperi]|uniref:Uncharacterized protein n=1 Tax=Wickerhamomyces pijperi TaxID=599730 RepID=A0A9P8Q316_WICPI|nr:hypothetical protein WICPIJ_005918 [Wickerhamomyces pijperi]
MFFASLPSISYAAWKYVENEPIAEHFIEEEVSDYAILEVSGDYLDKQSVINKTEEIESNELSADGVIDAR